MPVNGMEQKGNAVMLKLMQKDALLEFFNLYLRRAAAQLSELLEIRLYFTVLNLDLHESSHDEAWFAEDESIFAASCEASAVCAAFTEQDGRKLAALFLKKEFVSVQVIEDILLECSSVVLNAFTEGLAVLQERRLNCSLPRLVCNDLWRECFVRQPENLLRLNLTFSIDERSVDGIFSLAAGVGSAEVFLQKTDVLLGGEGVKYGKAAD